MTKVQKLRAFSAVLAAVMLVGGCSLPTTFRSRDLTRDKELASLDRLLTFARLHERQGKSQEAIQIYEQVLKNEPGQPLVHHRLGVLAAKDGDIQGAIEHFEAAKANGPATPELLADLGYALYLVDDFAGAEQHLRESLSRDSRSKSAHNNLGLVLAEMGRFGEALSEFAMGGSEAQSYANLAYVQSQHGALDESSANYHHALELDPEMRSAAEALIQLAEQSGELQPGLARRQRPQALLARRAPPRGEPGDAAELPTAAHASAIDPSSSGPLRLASTSVASAPRIPRPAAHGDSPQVPPVIVDAASIIQSEPVPPQFQPAGFESAARPITSFDHPLPAPVSFSPLSGDVMPTPVQLNIGD